MIAIYDSGIGGLSIYKAIRQKLPRHDILYIADRAYFPYGEKPAAVIRKRAEKIFSLLETKNADIIVVACNTVTVCAIDWLRKKYPRIPIVGVVPVIKTCVKRTKTDNIGVIATQKTARSSYQKRLIKKFASSKRVFVFPCSRLVKAIEGGGDVASNAELVMTIKKFRDRNVDVLALGCTHFPLVLKQIQQIAGPNMTVLDPSDAVARQVARIADANKVKAGSSSTTFFTTKDAKKIQAAIKKYLGVKKSVKLLSV